MDRKFSDKGRTTKAVKAILGDGFKVQTCDTCTIIRGDIAEAKELLAGYALIYATKEVCGQLWVWEK